MVTPDGRVIQYAYDNDSRLTHITPQAGQVFAFSYDNADRRTALSYPNGVTAAYAYDARSRLTGLEYRTSGNAIIDTFTYTLDAVGNRLTRADNEYQYTYSYDPTYRLTQSQPALTAQNPIFSQSTEAFTYDAVGNRLIGPAYPKAGTFQQSYSYDYENRIVSATRQVTGNPNADTVTFKYDPFGRRVEKNVSTYENGIATIYKYTYVYDNEDIILELLERTQNGNTTTTTTAYTHGPGIDEPLSLKIDGQTYYYHADGLGSITSITDSAETVVNRYAYDSFGVLKSSETIRNAYAYTGREYDSETGLYYYRARYYDPEAGRFVSKDPIGFEGGDVNLYGYVGNNSVNTIDPSGEIGIVGAAIGAGLEITTQLAMNKGAWNSIDWKHVAISAAIGAVAPGITTSGSKIWSSWQATRVLGRQLQNSKTANRISKIANRITSHKANIQEEVVYQAIWQTTKQLGKLTTSDKDCLEQ